MLEAFILFLIRKRLGLKKYEEFQFTNQRNKLKWYFIGPTRIMKQYYSPEGSCDLTCHSNISLNWLLDDRCKIIKKEV